MCCLSRLGTSGSVVVCCLLAVGGFAPLAGSQGTPVPQTQPQPTELRPRMREHFAKGAAIRDAVIRADLEGVRAPAKWLADHPQEDLPESAQPNILEMRRLAGEVAAAKDLPQAARGVARLAAACGACHTAIEVTPTLVAAFPRGEDETLKGEMKKHYRAAESPVSRAGRAVRALVDVRREGAGRQSGGARSCDADLAPSPNRDPGQAAARPGGGGRQGR